MADVNQNTENENSATKDTVKGHNYSPLSIWPPKTEKKIRQTFNKHFLVNNEHLTSIFGQIALHSYNFL